jgi:hypothetical protein
MAGPQIGSNLPNVALNTAATVTPTATPPSTQAVDFAKLTKEFDSFCKSIGDGVTAWVSKNMPALASLFHMASEPSALDETAKANLTSDQQVSLASARDSKEFRGLVLNEALKQLDAGGSITDKGTIDGLRALEVLARSGTGEVQKEAQAIIGQVAQHCAEVGNWTDATDLAKGAGLTPPAGTLDPERSLRGFLPKAANTEQVLEMVKEGRYQSVDLYNVVAGSIDAHAGKIIGDKAAVGAQFALLTLAKQGDPTATTLMNELLKKQCATGEGGRKYAELLAQGVPGLQLPPA